MPAQKIVSKAMILAAGMDLLKSGGFEAVNVKALARQLHCSTQPIYLSFKNMDELRAELTTAAVGEFLKAIGYSAKDSGLALCTIRYIQFAKDEKKLFQFLFMRPNAFLEMKQALEPVLAASIRQLMERFHLTYDEAHDFHDHLWMHAHGIASMIATDYCRWDMEKAGRMLRESEACFTQMYFQKRQAAQMQTDMKCSKEFQVQADTQCSKE